MNVLFNEEWNELPTPFPPIDSIIVYSNESIGFFAITSNALLYTWDYKDNYKLIALIAEKYTQGKPYIFCLESEVEFVQSWRNGNCTVSSIDNVIVDFPDNIIEIHKRSLLNLALKYPKYGKVLDRIENYDLFAENDEDFQFIMKSLSDRGFLNAEFTKNGNYQLLLDSTIYITDNGWIEIEAIKKKNNSKKVFIAMSFDQDLENASKAITNAIKSTGLIPMQINKKQYNNEISGEILQEISHSNILIADVTHQKNGVYFEAGFAMGLRKTVIWCCKKNDLLNVHFDTRQYNHIVWDNEDELYQKLRDRILGTIILNSDG